MSRGGFGGAGSGRGGSYGGTRRKIGGMEVTWDVDLDQESDYGPSELFPDMQPHSAEPPTKYERTSVARYRTLRDRIHQGPLYTVLGDNVRVTKAGASRGVIYDGFEDLPSYSQRKQRVRRRIPRLDTRPYVLHFFPEELRPVLDRNYSKVDDSVATKKRQSIAKTSKLNKLEELDNDEEGHLAEDDGDDIKEEQDDAEGEPLDDEYEEDEDDQNDDYNAEQYFSTGENDDGGDDEGGYGDDYD